MNKKIFLKPLAIVIVFAALILCAFYFTKKYDISMQERIAKESQDSYVKTYRVRYQKDTGGANSPQEAYEAFKSAMLEHNLDKALSYVFIDERPKAEYYIRGYLKQGKTYEDIADSLPKDIKQSEEYKCTDTFCATIKMVEYVGYIMDKKERVGDHITFVLTFNNKWQIESF